jgi:hypothetical protein
MLPDDGQYVNRAQASNIYDKTVLGSNVVKRGEMEVNKSDKETKFTPKGIASELTKPASPSLPLSQPSSNSGSPGTDNNSSIVSLIYRMTTAILFPPIWNQQSSRYQTVAAKPPIPKQHASLNPAVTNSALRHP